MDKLSTKNIGQRNYCILILIHIHAFVQFKIQRRQYTVDGFIFVGTNFRGLINSWGSKFMVIQKIANSWVLEFLDRTLQENHENWYPKKMKPSTGVVSFSLSYNFD